MRLVRLAIIAYWLVTLGLETTGAMQSAARSGEKTYVNSIGMKMVRVQPGSFVMGADNTPLSQQQVTLQKERSEYRKSRLEPEAKWEGVRKGFVGVEYSECDFSITELMGPREKIVLKSFNQDWSGKSFRWSNSKRTDRTWSAKWRGVIKAPVTGKVRFTAQVSKGLLLTIDGKVVINGWRRDNDKELIGETEMVEGQMVPVVLQYSHNGDGTESFMRIYWSWPGQEKVIVPADALYHRAEDYNASVKDFAFQYSKPVVRERLKWGDYDEIPRHKVTITQPFYMSETEVTVEQFKQFRPDYPGYAEHNGLAGAASWYDAVAFCKWLSKKEGKTYRLPTEAEWEYACRAGTKSVFWSGDKPPEQGQVSPWGLKNMHSGLAEWCQDWYGPYSRAAQVDPVGPEKGWMKVVRGGGLDVQSSYHGGGSGKSFRAWVPCLSPFYRRCANRAAIAPSFGPPPAEYQELQRKNRVTSGDTRCYRAPYRLAPGRHSIGFRVVQAPMPKTKPAAFEKPLFHRCVKQKAVQLEQGPDMSKPFYRVRRVIPDLGGNSHVEVGWRIGLAPGLGSNQHNSALQQLPNGDLLAAYYNGFVEDEPDLTIVTCRLRWGSDQWDMPSIWPDFLDGNDAAPIIWNDNGTIWFFWGCPHLGGGYPFQYVKSTDNGATWSQVQFPLFETEIGPHTPQPISNAFRDKDGTIYVAVDCESKSSVLFASRNDGRTWYDTGGRTYGRHTTVVPLKDGSFLGMGGKNSNIDGFMPKSISTDKGRTWIRSKSPLPSLGGGQRPNMIRLKSGRLFYAGDFQTTGGQQPEGYTQKGAFAAVSDDEGLSWKIRKLTMGAIAGKPGVPKEVTSVGYVTACQSANGIINIVNTRMERFHFQLNEAWVLDKNKEDVFESEEDLRVEPTSVKEYVERYPNGQVKVRWKAGVSRDGCYLLHGKEVWYYEDGRKKWEVNYVNGKKDGREIYWNKDGSKRYEWDFDKPGHGKWIVWNKDGTIKAKSEWQDKRLLNYEIVNP